MVDGATALAMPNRNPTAIQLPTMAITWDRDSQTWFHGPEGEEWLPARLTSAPGWALLKRQTC